MLMAVHVVEDALRPVYAVVGGGIAGVSCAEEVIMCACSIKLGDASWKRSGYSVYTDLLLFGMYVHVAVQMWS